MNKNLRHKYVDLLEKLSIWTYSPLQDYINKLPKKDKSLLEKINSEVEKRRQELVLKGYKIKVTVR